MAVAMGWWKETTEDSLRLPPSLWMCGIFWNLTTAGSPGKASDSSMRGTPMWSSGSTWQAQQVSAHARSFCSEGWEGHLWGRVCCITLGAMRQSSHVQVRRGQERSSVGFLAAWMARRLILAANLKQSEVRLLLTPVLPSRGFWESPDWLPHGIDMWPVCCVKKPLSAAYESRLN